jgi:hypothetical protein
VLLRENLGRRHEGDLQSILHRDKCGKQRNDRLSRPDVSLQKPVHGCGALHVLDNLLQCAPLTLGQPEWKDAPR